jgi:hypothetical protein
MSNRFALIRPRVYLSLAGSLVLVAIVAWVVWHFVHGQGPQSSSPPVSGNSLTLPHFKDITDAAGIDFQHVNGYTDMSSKLLPETMSGGVAVLDYDHSGRQSILFVNSCYWPGTEKGRPTPTMKLYRNRGNDKFEDATHQTGLDKISFYGMGVSVGDYDNSGYPSVFISGVGDHRLLRNEDDGHGNRRFVDVTDKSGDLASRGGWPTPAQLRDHDFYKHDQPVRFESSCTWLDYDGDGKLDLFVCCYVTWSPALDLGLKYDPFKIGRFYPIPGQYDGCQCFLYHNEGGGVFKDVSEKARIHVLGEKDKPLGKSLGVIAFDYDDTGLPSLFVANDSVRNFFFRNQGDGTFEEVGVAAGIAAERNARGGMGIDVGEYRPDQFATLVCNFTLEPNSFLRYDKKSRDKKNRSFRDEAAAVGIDTPSRPWVKFGCFFFDFDLSGRLSLLTNNGHLDAEVVIKQKEQYRQKPQLFWNSGQYDKPQFVAADAESVGGDLFTAIVGRGCAFADIDGNGYPDVVLVDNGGKARLLHNEGGLGNSWIRFELEGDGTHSNRSAIGAWIEIKAGDLVQRRYIVAGRGYLSQSELPVTFGLGKETKIDSVTIRWPGKEAGKTVIDGKELDVKKFYRVRQEGDRLEDVTSPKR